MLRLALSSKVHCRMYDNIRQKVASTFRVPSLDDTSPFEINHPPTAMGKKDEEKGRGGKREGERGMTALIDFSVPDARNAVALKK